MIDRAALDRALPARSGSLAEAEALRAVAERTRGERLGVVGDVPLWLPEALASLVALAAAGAARAGWVSPATAAWACVLVAVLVAAQLLGARLLDGLCARSPTWAVALGPLRAASPVLVLPTDLPAPGLTAARVVLALLVLALPWAPVGGWATLAVPAALAWVPGRRPAAWTWFCEAAPVARELGTPVLLCGGSRRDARGLLGALDWKHVERAPVVWVVGVGGGVVHLPRVAPWALSAPARRWLLDPAVLRLYLRGHAVWVVGADRGQAFDPGPLAQRWASPLAVGVARALEQAGASR